MRDIDQTLWNSIALSVAAYLAMLCLAAMANIHVDQASFVALFWFVSVFAAAGTYCMFRGMRRFAFALFGPALILFSTLPVLISTYIAMGAGYPLADDFLMRTDRLLGFDWLAFIAAVDRHPFFANALAEGYQSFSLQLLLLPAVLAFAGFGERALVMAMAYLLLCLAAAAISVFFPSLGAYVGYGIDQSALQSINAHFGYFFLDQFHGVRAEGPFVIEAGKAAGIITFPSVHAAVALLCAWAVLPLKYLRVPIIILNMLMFVSAISHGGHYLIDLPAGAVVACFGIFAARRLSRARVVRPAMLPDPSPAATSD